MVLREREIETRTNGKVRLFLFSLFFSKLYFICAMA